MATLTNEGNFGGELPNLRCDLCDMVFSIVWNRNPMFDEPQYCPFCGDSIDEIIWEERGDASE